MSKLSKEELLRWLGDANEYFTEVIGATSFKKIEMADEVEGNGIDVSKEMQQKIIDKGKQAYQQIKESIQKPEVTEEEEEL